MPAIQDIPVEDYPVVVISRPVLGVTAEDLCPEGEVSAGKDLLGNLLMAACAAETQFSPRLPGGSIVRALRECLRRAVGDSGGVHAAAAADAEASKPAATTGPPKATDSRGRRKPHWGRKAVSDGLARDFQSLGSVIRFMFQAKAVGFPNTWAAFSRLFSLREVARRLGAAAGRPMTSKRLIAAAPLYQELVRQFSAADGTSPNADPGRMAGDCLVGSLVGVLQQPSQPDRKRIGFEIAEELASEIAHAGAVDAAEVRDMAAHIRHTCPGEPGELLARQVEGGSVAVDIVAVLLAEFRDNPDAAAMWARTVGRRSA